MSQNVNLVVDQGSNLEIQINVTHANGDVWDLSTYSVNSKVRKHFTSNTSYDFSGTGYANGLILLTMNAENSANVSAGRYRYDVEVVSTSNTTTRVQEGIIEFTPEVTK